MLFRNIVAKVSNKIATIFFQLSFKLASKARPRNEVQYLRCQPWFRDNGDKTLRLNYELNLNSVVFDIGGYEGQWAADMFSKYGCHVYIFEPFEHYAQNIRRRFACNEKVRVFEFGLSNGTKNVQLNIADDSSSLFKNGGPVIDVFLRKAIDFFQEYNIVDIDVMKINIEGGEYDLLEHLINSGFVTNIKNIQVQFHDFVPNAESRMRRIQDELSKTHFTTYRYEFVWENWRLK